jgi:hypothetical protein
MATDTYKARIKLSNGSTQEIRVQADSSFNAKAMIEAQYGKGCILNGPSKA